MICDESVTFCDNEEFKKEKDGFNAYKDATIEV